MLDDSRSHGLTRGMVICVQESSLGTEATEGLYWHQLNCSSQLRCLYCAETSLYAMSEYRQRRPRLASADSTLEPPSKKMKKKKKHSSRRERATSSSKYSVEESKRNVQKEVESHSNGTSRPQPLAHYVHNRKDLLEQVFDILSETDLNRILPASLKSTASDELKELCLRHLKRVSEKRLLSIIANESYQSDSHSEGDAEDSRQTQLTLYEPPSEPVVSSGICDMPPCSSVSSTSKRQMSVNVGGEEDTIELMVEDDSLDDGIDEVCEELSDDHKCPLSKMSPEQSEPCEKQEKSKSKQNVNVKVKVVDESVSLTELEMREKALRSELKREQVESVMDSQTKCVSAAKAVVNQSEPRALKKVEAVGTTSSNVERDDSKKNLLLTVKQRQKELLMLRQKALESMITLCKNQKQGKVPAKYAKKI